MSYAVVVVDVFSLRHRCFHYSIPRELGAEALPGARVVVPFGKRDVTGVITHLASQSPVTRTRDIKRVLDSEPLYSPQLLDLAQQVASDYAAPVARVLAAMLPAALRYRGDRLVTLLPQDEGLSGSLNGVEKDVVGLLLERGTVSLSELKRSIGSDAKRALDQLEKKRVIRTHTAFTARTKQKQQLRVVLAVGEATALARAEEQRSRAPRRAQVLKDLVDSGGSLAAKDIPASIRQRLVEQGMVSVEEELLRRRPSDGLPFGRQVVQLSRDQEEALRQLRHNPTPGLLHGVTGSGKTEVYMHVIEHALQRGQQAIVLVPEISLTPQTVGVFRRRFGDDIGILHSGLGLGERYDEWHRIHRGEARVVIGARSAVFAPVKSLGAIIVDEEHETSYKQEESPRYHARRVAEIRARQHGASLILGSATPALESYFRALEGQLQLVRLGSRVAGATMPPFSVVDMRQEMESGNRSMFSRLLQDKMATVISQGARVILFLNRRGYSSFMLCRECGHVVECSQCEVSLTLHARNQRLRCHYCDFSQPAPDVCPECESSYIRGFGAGTERLESEVRRLFPHAPVWRMDADTTTRRGAHQKILEEFSRTPGAVLVGTQMIAKGLDISDVQLVGIVTADTALNLPDFRSAERTFQLVSQVAGRSGRDGPGEVLLQTYHPDHYAIEAASRHDYEGFYQQEIALRQQAGFPPFSHLARLIVSAHGEVTAQQAAASLAKVPADKALQILGPAPAPLSRLHGLYRWQLLIKGESRPHVLSLAESMYNSFERERVSAVRLTVDIDPLSML